MFLLLSFSSSQSVADIQHVFSTQLIQKGYVNEGYTTKAYLSLIGEAVGADDAFVILNRGFGVTWFIFAPEVHVVQAKSFRVALVPFKLVK